MKFRSATQAAIAQICALERLPEFRTMVGSWPEHQHMRMLADPDAVYIVAEDQTGRIAGFAILQGLLSEHRQVELKRLVVRTPNQGVGKHRYWKQSIDPGAKHPQTRHGKKAARMDRSNG